MADSNKENIEFFITVLKDMYPAVDWQGVYEKQGHKGLMETFHWWRLVTEGKNDVTAD